MLVVSSLSVSSVAFAGEKDTALETVEQLVDSFNGNVAVAKPSAEDLAAYDKITAAFKDLSKAQKESMDIFMFDKMLHLVYDRERQVSIAENTQISASDKQHYINAGKAAETVLGSLPSYLDEAQTLAASVADTKASAASKEAAFKKASVNARYYAGCWYKSYSMFYYKVDSYPTKAFDDVVNTYTKAYVKDNPFTETEPQKVLKPNEKDFEGGVTNPEYVAQLKAYMEYQKALAEYKCRKANYEAAYSMETMEKMAQYATEYQPLVIIMKKALEAVAAYDADNSKTALAGEVVRLYDSATAAERLLIDKDAITINTIPVEYTSYWSTTAQKVTAVYKACIDISNAQYLTDFLAVMEGIDKPYTNEKIAIAKEAYAKVPSTLQNKIPDDVKQKYKDILAAVQPDTPSSAKPDMSSFSRTAVSYPQGAPKADVEVALSTLKGALGELTATLPQLVKTGVYTNATVSMVAQFLYPLVAGLEPTLLGNGPQDLANKLTESKFEGAVATLTSITTKDENGKVIKNIDDWAKLSFKNGDMGFQDGDKEGFLDAVAALFRPFSIITMALTLENTISTTNGTYTYGAYEDLVSVFETLELPGVLSSHEYTLYGKAQEAISTNLKMDAKVRPILVPVFNLIDSIAADPVNGVMNLLPKLGLLLKDDLLDTQIHKLASKVKLVTLPEFSLKTKDLFNMIAPALQGIAVNNTTVSFVLSETKFVQFMNDIAGCGTPVVKSSITRENAYRLGIEPDQADTFVTAFRWLYGEITTKANLNAIKAIINSFDVKDIDIIQKWLLTTAVGLLGDMSADDVLNLVVPALLPAKEGEEQEKKPETKPTDTSTSSGTSNKGNGAGSGSDSSSEGIPATGDASIAIFAATAMTAGLAIVLFRKKKEQHQ